MGKVKMTGLAAGMVVLWADPTLPEGWLWADGSTFDPEEHPDLFAALGTDHVPELRFRGEWSRPYKWPYIVYTGHGQ